MPREFTRAERVGDAIQQELVTVIRDEMRDPRVAFATITAVDVNKDLSTAKVWVTFVGKSEAEAEKAVAALNGAAGFLRSQLAKSVKMRFTPSLRFVYDASGERGQRLSALIDYAVAKDKSKERAQDDSSGDSGANSEPREQ